MKYLKFAFFSLIIILISQKSRAQQPTLYPAFRDEVTKKIAEDSTSKFHISSVTVTGNKRTKNYIILRELQFREGDSIIAGRLFDLLQQSRNLVYNTSLFSEVTISPVLISAKELTLNITVLEKLYVFPVPQFKLVDRNFNEWLKTYHANLNRVIYGIKFAHYNLSGRGDKLSIYLLNGYARAVSFSYSAPYSNGALTEGFSFSGGYSQSREFPYKTSYENSLLQFKKTGFARDNFFIGASYQRRRGYFRRNIFSVYYNYIKVNDSTILPQYNPAYFNLNARSAGFPDIRYSYLYSNTNNINYPLKGRILGASVLKRGLDFSGGINMLSVDGNCFLFFSHKQNWYSSLELQGNIKLPFKLAYINQQELGYRDFMLRGLEYYVVDGAAAVVSKYTLKKKLVSFDIPIHFFRIKKIPVIPFTIYAKTYADMGYSYNQKQYDTRLNNRFLYTAGFGLDIVSIYDATLRVEYSFNQLGQNGLFLHARSLF